MAIARFTYGSVQGCGGKINVTNSANVQIQSYDANNDGNYEPEMNCQWMVTGEPGKVLKLTFTTFNIEQDQNNTLVQCWDYIEVRDGHR